MICCMLTPPPPPSATKDMTLQDEIEYIHRMKDKLIQKHVPCLNDEESREEIINLIDFALLVYVIDKFSKDETPLSCLGESPAGELSDVVPKIQKRCEIMAKAISHQQLLLMN